MSDAIYTFKGKDITFAICIQIRAVINELQKRLDISFEDAMYLFYRSETYKTLQETENAFWAESAEYIADCYFGEGFLALAEAKNPCDVELVHKMKWETMTFNVFRLSSLRGCGKSLTSESWAATVWRRKRIICLARWGKICERDLAMLIWAYVS